MEQIRKYLEKILEIDEKDWDIFSSKLKKRNFKKKSNLLIEGQVENYLSFIEKELSVF